MGSSPPYASSLHRIHRCRFVSAAPGISVRRAASPPFDLDFFRTLEHPDSFDPAEVLDVYDMTSKVTSVHSRRNSYLFRRLTVIIRESLQSGFTSMSSDISGVKKTVADQAAEI